MSEAVYFKKCSGFFCDIENTINQINETVLEKKTIRNDLKNIGWNNNDIVTNLKIKNHLVISISLILVVFIWVRFLYDSSLFFC